jgi:hypothetical protein
MGYLQDADRWLDGLIEQVADEKMEVTELKRALREKILESYRNGEKAGWQSVAVPTPPESRSEKKQAGKPQRFTGEWQCAKCGGGDNLAPLRAEGQERRAAPVP